MRIQRLRLSDGVPLSFDETYLPEDLGHRVMADDLAKEPIFTLLEERYETPLVEAEYVLEAAAAESAVAMALEIPAGSPVFLIERTSYASDTGRWTTRDYTTEVTKSGSGPASTDAVRAHQSAVEMLAATSVSSLFCMSVVASAFGGALGMASGMFIVPILTIVAGLDVRVAIGASIVSVIACSCGSAAPFLKERLTNVRLAVVLETATT